MERGEIHGSLVHKKKLLSSHGTLSTTSISALQREYSQLEQGYVKTDNREPGGLKEENEGETFKVRPIAAAVCVENDLEKG